MLKRVKFTWISAAYCFSAEIYEATALTPTLSCRREFFFTVVTSTG